MGKHRVVNLETTQFICDLLKRIAQSNWRSILLLSVDFQSHFRSVNFQGARFYDWILPWPKINNSITDSGIQCTQVSMFQNKNSLTGDPVLFHLASEKD